MTSARICLYKFQLFVDLDINTLRVVFNKLRNFIFSVFIFYFSISFGATKFTSPRASNYLRPALHRASVHQAGSEIGSSPLEGCEGNCRPGGR